MLASPVNTTSEMQVSEYVAECWTTFSVCCSTDLIPLLLLSFKHKSGGSFTRCTASLMVVKSACKSGTSDCGSLNFKFHHIGPI